MGTQRRTTTILTITLLTSTILSKVTLARTLRKVVALTKPKARSPGKDRDKPG